LSGDPDRKETWPSKLKLVGKDLIEPAIQIGKLLNKILSISPRKGKGWSEESKFLTTHRRFSAASSMSNVSVKPFVGWVAYSPARQPRTEPLRRSKAPAKLAKNSSRDAGRYPEVQQLNGTATSGDWPARSGMAVTRAVAGALSISLSATNTNSIDFQ
jgi:hypothetical protein